MTLQAVRRQFVERSGRYDLVLDDLSFEDNGADFFINAGQRWLDRSFEIYKSHGRFDVEIPVGQWHALVPGCRVIEEVWASTITGEKWKLGKVDARDIRAFLNGMPPVGYTTRGQVYATVFLRSANDSSSTTLIDQFGEVIFEDSNQPNYTLNGIVIYPPAAELLFIEVHGIFFQPRLVNGTDTNMWTEEDPFILVLAAMRAVEVTMRNRQGVLDYESAVKEELFGIEKDFANQLSMGHQQMEG